MEDFTAVNTIFSAQTKLECFREWLLTYGQHKCLSKEIPLKTVRIKRKAEYYPNPEEDQPKIEGPNDIYSVLTPIYERLSEEADHTVMLVLNIANEVTGFKVISSGTQSSGPADGKIIFRAALMLGASKIILAHNHPSGQLSPSKSDIRVTEKLIQAGNAIGIPLVDHLIVTHRGYLSFRGEQLCAFPPFV